jgi:hypothetical protein
MNYSASGSFVYKVFCLSQDGAYKKINSHIRHLWGAFKC